MTLRRAVPTSGWHWRNAWLWILTSILGAFVAFRGHQSVLVTFPLAAGLIAAGVFFSALRRKTGGSIPWFEIGAVYTTVITLYLVYPLIGFLVLGGTYTPLSDARLAAFPPEAAEVGRIAWLYVSHLLGFAVAYLLFRGRLRRIQPRPKPPAISTLAALLIIFLSIHGFDVALGLMYPSAVGNY